MKRLITMPRARGGSAAGPQEQIAGLPTWVELRDASNLLSGPSGIEDSNVIGTLWVAEGRAPLPEAIEEFISAFPLKVPIIVLHTSADTSDFVLELTTPIARCALVLQEFEEVSSALLRALPDRVPYCYASHLLRHALPESGTLLQDFPSQMLGIVVEPESGRRRAEPPVESSTDDAFRVRLRDVLSAAGVTLRALRDLCYLANVVCRVVEARESLEAAMKGSGALHGRKWVYGRLRRVLGVGGIDELRELGADEILMRLGSSLVHAGAEVQQPLPPLVVSEHLAAVRARCAGADVVRWTPDHLLHQLTWLRPLIQSAVQRRFGDDGDARCLATDIETLLAMKLSGFVATSGDVDRAVWTVPQEELRRYAKQCISLSIRNEYRRRRARRRRFVRMSDSSPPGWEPVDPASVAAASDGDMSDDRIRLKRAAAAALEKLPELQRKVIEGVVINSRTARGVAAELGVTIAALRKVKAAGLARLRSEVDKMTENGGGRTK